MTITSTSDMLHGVLGGKNAPMNFAEMEKRMALQLNETVGHMDDIDGIDCPICKNKGVIYYTDDECITVSIRECQCMVRRRSIQYAKSSGLGHLLNSQLSDYVISEDWQQDLKDLALNYIREGSAKKFWMAILGQSGAGKTHICSAISKALIESGIELRYVIWSDAMATIKDEMFQEDLNSNNTLLYKLKHVPALYIDDLYKGKVTDRDISLTYALINYRYNNDLLTMVTSEYLLAQLRKVDEAIAGRICERCGKDYLYQIAYDQQKNYRFKTVK